MSLSNDLSSALPATDPLCGLLTLPVDFTVNPLSLTTTTSDDSGDDTTRLSLDDKTQKTKDRILRNRAAAQASRDKKRRYVADLESSNKQLKEENEQVTKRAKVLESENALLKAEMEELRRQLTGLEGQIQFGDNASALFHSFCDSARIARKNLITRFGKNPVQTCRRLCQ
ncbi:uncharacterized protein BYT42DRAFT_537883 [Radiomyces spectabilis]|uniref:uncharacterized protein n=1 Tax=Radiomyces spectabilis TaxID=64574 RepID=UPI00221EDF72|nr:uncharacterized protein BYT42DRAFT_537883 [Radiomyces spectabilis]KAI8370404.1 hypothetical protein BYT42DRAFT_537883 [Radiomyces spectabilis]